MAEIFQSRPELSAFQIGSKWRVNLGSSSNGVVSKQHLPFDGKIGEVVGYNEEIPGVVSVESIVYPIRLRFDEPELPTSEQSFAPFQLEPVWRKAVREYIAERQATHRRHKVPEPYHRVIERVAEAYSADIEDVQSYFFEEFQKTPEYQVLQRQGEVHG
ncbi:MAG: hypothetical protein HY314_17795 [Acidobacteria bacterium]|nr:hypothetical protein [Acidobacteriota bacterium]